MYKLPVRIRGEGKESYIAPCEKERKKQPRIRISVDSKHFTGIRDTLVVYGHFESMLVSCIFNLFDI